MSLFHKHKPTRDKPLIVSGYGLTQYEIQFCKDCGAIIWKLTLDYDNLYPKLKGKRK